jgi:hypothetical protein
MAEEPKYTSTGKCSAIAVGHKSMLVTCQCLLWGINTLLVDD